MVRGLGRQGLPAAIDFAPGLPEAIAVGQAVESAFAIEARLLQRFVSAGHTLRGPPVATCITCAAHQPGDGPGLCRAVPFDPRQALAVGTHRRRGIEVGTLGEHFAGLFPQGDQAMLDPFAMLLLDRQHQAVVPLHIAIAAAGIIGQGAR
ncbi:hypothetical protein D3C75_1048090 [compost metagenome]